MSVVIRSCLLKGNRFLRSFRNVPVNYICSRWPLITTKCQKLTRTAKFHPVISAHCSNVSNGSKIQDPGENTRKTILEDEDIQNILRDFAKDFDVDEESDRILEDIKRTHTLPENDETEPRSSCKESESLDAYREVSKRQFQEFQDADNVVIKSYEEEISQSPDEDYFFHIDDQYRKVKHVEAKRGVTGVYDIHELVDALREENLFDVVVIHIPPSYHYADYLVIATAKSPRHLKVAAENILKFYKMKKDKSDPFVKIEGEKLDPWKAVDLGNIVLHLFLEDTRSFYDLESLWLLDPEYDSGGEKQEDSEELDALKEQMEFLDSLQLHEESASSNLQ